MSSIRKRHEDFIRELQAPLKSRKDCKEKDILSDNGSKTIASDIELQKELERKFYELFGAADDDN